MASRGRRTLRPLASFTATLATFLVYGVTPAAFGISFASAQSAAAPDERVERARELFREAEQKERAGAYEAALTLFRGVGALQMTPAVRFHMGHCEESLGHLGAAFAEYTTARQEAEEKGKRETSKAAEVALLRIEPRVAKLRARCVTTAVRCNFLVDGKRIETPDGVARVDSGIRMIQLSAHAKSMRKDVSAVDGTTLDVDEEFPSFVTGPVPLVGARLAATDPSRDSAGLRPPSSEAAEHRSRLPALLATGGALVLVGAGVAAFTFAGHAQDEALQKCPELVSCAGTRSRIRAWDAAALGSWVSAAVLGTLAIVWWARPMSPGLRSAGRQGKPANTVGPSHSFWASTSATGAHFGGTF